MTPLAQVEYETTEFQWQVRTNSLGLRDRELAWSTKRGRRVLAVGDSFTMGWGVQVEDCWVKLLENNLRRTGLTIDVINAGKGGMGTEWYAETVENLVPVLQPDLVIVAVLQGDDLAQATATVDQLSMSATTRLFRRLAKGVAQMAYPNLLRLRQFGGRVEPTRVLMHEEWAKEATERINRMNPEEKRWFNRLDPTVQRLFVEGNLNPGLVTLAMAEPDHLRMTLHPEEEKTRIRVSNMAKHLERVSAVGARYHTKVLVCSVPLGPFVSLRQWERVRRIGFVTEDNFLSSTNPDVLVRAASGRAKIAFTSVTAAFRQASNLRPLYYEWDGHFNQAGHELFADLLTPVVSQYLSP